MKIPTAIICSLLLTFFTSCFDSVENNQIVGPYFINAVDIPANMSVVYNEKEDFSGGSEVVGRTVYEIKWNDNFIIAKQHPDNIERTIVENYGEHIFDSLKKSGYAQNIHWISDSLAKRKYSIERQNGKFEDFENKSKSEITFYYLIEASTKSPYSTLFYTQGELDSAIIKLKVGQLNNKKYYGYLDKR